MRACVKEAEGVKGRMTDGATIVTLTAEKVRLCIQESPNGKLVIILQAGQSILAIEPVNPKDNGEINLKITTSAPPINSPVQAQNLRFFSWTPQRVEVELTDDPELGSIVTIIPQN